MKLMFSLLDENIGSISPQVTLSGANYIEDEEDFMNESNLNCIKINNALWDARFYPSYTPKQMLDIGVFGGTYLNKIRDKYPKEWFDGDRVLPPGSHPDDKLNKYGVHSGLRLIEWDEHGWIMTDKLGWFEWYCNYYLGRRLPEDDTQIKRWLGTVRRHQGQLVNHPEQNRIKQKQTLLQWAYNWEDKFNDSYDINVSALIENSKKESKFTKKYYYNK